MNTPLNLSRRIKNTLKMARIEGLNVEYDEKLNRVIEFGVNINNTYDPYSPFNVARLQLKYNVIVLLPCKDFKPGTELTAHCSGVKSEGWCHDAVVIEAIIERYYRNPKTSRH